MNGPTAAAKDSRIGARLGLWALLALVALLFVWPVVMLFVGIFRSGAPGMPGTWTLAGLSRVLGAPATYAALSNSMLYALFTTALATVLGAVAAFAATRTLAWGRQLLTPVMLLVFAAPNLLYAVAWSLLGDPGAGLLNQAARALTHPGVTVFNAFSWTGMVFVQALKLSSFCYLLLLAPFQNMNRSYEEASLICGAGRLGTLGRIDLPLMLPALFGVVILGAVFGLGAFDIPQILGALAGIPVLSTEVYKTLNIAVPPDYAGASALGLFMMLTVVLLLVAQWSVLKANRFVTVTGKTFRQERWDLGAWNAAVGGGVLLFTLLTLVLPGVQLVLTSFQPAIGVNSFTLSNYQSVLNDRQTVRGFQVTAALAVLSGFLATALALVLGQVGRREALWVQRALDAASLTPVMMPGVVLAVGLLWAYISVPGLRLLYGTFWLTLIGLVVFVMPIASRAIGGALVQISADLEEAAAISGASPARVLIDIVLALISRSFLASWLVAGVVAAGTLDIPLLLLPATSPNVAVLVYSDMSSGLPTRASALLVLLLAGIALVAALAALLVWLARRLRAARPVSFVAATPSP
ncbi:MAG TPA: ABC transporter permease subunit [Burkholderiaceae bacterium]|nr:ABC transporter permease subunit [Burkholderiaceae bacterium]